MAPFRDRGAHGHEKTGLTSIATVCQAAGATRADFEQALPAGDERPERRDDRLGVDDLPVPPGRDHQVVLLDDASSPSSVYDLMAEKAKREHFAACREELRFLEESGALIRREAHEKLIVDFGALVKTRLEQLPAQHAARLSALDGPRALEREFDELVWVVLVELAAEADRMTE